MKILFILMLSFGSFSAFALKGVITVLEAPLFEKPDRESHVIQYARKGAVIYLHLAADTKDEFENSSPSLDLQEKTLNKFSDENNKTQKLQDNTYWSPEKTPGFLLTQDRRGHDAYILKEHVFLYYEDERELTQKTIQPDPTDYRLVEPLPPGYPLIKPTGYRGSFGFGISQPYTENYPYPDKIRTKGYSTGFVADITFSRHLGSDTTNRWYIGGLFTARSFSQNFSISTRVAKEQWTKLGTGAYLSYDAYKGQEQQLTLYMSPLFYFFNQATISQQDFSSNQSETRQYQSLSMAARAGAYYQWLDVFYNVDFYAGVWGEVESPQILQAKTTAQQPTWWRNSGHDKFTTNVVWTLAGQIGLQSSY